MNLLLDEPAAAMVRDVLDAAYRDLKFEIADTDNSTFKAELRERESTMRAVLDSLGGPLPDRS